MEMEGGKRLLVPQLQLLRHCFVAALGGKTARRIGYLGLRYDMKVFSAGPPGANRPQARRVAPGKAFSEWRERRKSGQPRVFGLSEAKTGGEGGIDSLRSGLRPNRADFPSGLARTRSVVHERSE